MVVIMNLLTIDMYGDILGRRLSVLEYLLVTINISRTQIASKTLRHQGPIFWYKISSEIKAKQTVKSFGYCLKRNIVETHPIL